ncbi:MAG: glycogen synthase GlgA [Candidatus Omnitrophica bacterium]|nr:glycogen synthase GlgA [Candidatus Omnitrophota bacterium]MDD5671310.1 glycogen synthase GlgA [Candidatus Omnitrophota bacterium]
MKIVIVAPEIGPYAKTGGLADVAGSLPLEIQALGHEVIAFLPRYKSVDIAQRGLKPVIEELPVPIGSEKVIGKVYGLTHPGGAQFLFIDHPEFFNRDELYGTPHGDYPDNDVRFTFFQRGVLETLRILKVKPDVIHCHDWQAGLIPVYLKTIYANEQLFKKTKTIFTVHNLAYQGNFPPDSLPCTGLGWEHFRMERLEYYGKVSFLKGGVVFSDAITTVSPNYAKEIQGKEYGCGFEGVLMRRRDDISGILNGLDYHVWNPATDPDIVAHYTLDTFDDKGINKKALQKENNLEQDPKIPLFGIVSRLVDQKGIDILIPILQDIAEMGAQFVLLGTGDEKYHQIFRDIAKRNRYSFGIHIVFDSKMAKRFYAGCDVLFVPSYYEPCGLAQMIALRYGTIPIVRGVGGLADTIQEFDPKTEKGNGFTFQDYTSVALLGSVKRAFEIYKDKKSWRAIVRNAMQCDYSWAASAKKFLQLYDETKRVSVGNLGEL